MSQELESFPPEPAPVLRQTARDSETERSEEIFDGWLDVDLNETDQSASAGSAVVTAPEANEITFEGTLRINGYAAGRIRSDTGTLIVDAGGEVDADISVHYAIIHGCVRGDIHAREKVELGGTAKVIGDIETVALSIEPGAVFEGRCIFVPQSAS